MLTNKDIRVENGNIVINGDKYPLDGQSPEAIMAIVEDNSDTTPTENSTAPITSGGTYTAIGTVNTAIGAVIDTIGDITQTGVTGATVAAQIAALKTADLKIGVLTSASVTVRAGWRQFVDFTLTEALPTDTVAIFVIETASPEAVFANYSEYDSSNLKVKIGVYNTSNEDITGTYKVAYLYT